MNLRLPRPSDIDRLFRRTRLKRALARSLPADSPFRRVSIEAWLGDEEFDHRFRLQKDGSTIGMGFDYRRVLRDRRLFGIFRQRAGTILEMFARTDPSLPEARAEISDGSESAAGWISFCSAQAGAILVPDADFRNNDGYAGIRALAAGDGPDWNSRSGGFCWRGSTTGKGLITSPEMVPEDPDLIQRTRFCLLGRGLQDVDAKFARLTQSRNASEDLARLRHAGSMADMLDGAAWRGKKFAFDLDGNSNAWSNLFTRLLLGCCVIKVASPRGYRQWYYDDMAPFEHYVPVAADLSDLAERLDWCRSHDAESRRIAEQGQALALSMTLESELSKGTQRISQAFGVTAAGAPRAKAM